ncbi:LPP20 family lipoprotein [Enterovibrio coralii]|uniref:Lipoprotein LPP20-like domain-containing protein n=1 Tax=Enterovibrio coralii TaxID=294935 RepID=A0A135IDM6_9GAMM|nr:LPP20 family lipoprotein [Enterovibrio coralii]KXF83444.1 hypothetical protein ATN88_04705 [Enterovibrio coralii]
MKKLSLILLPFLMVGCKSTTPPDWYFSEETNNPSYIYAVGEGRSLSLAKKNAVGQINEQLWTQVDSSFTQHDQFREINNSSLSYQNVQNTVNAKSAQLTLTGTEYLKTDKNDIAYYVQARIKRDNVESQLKSELAQINNDAKASLIKLTHQDKLLWWLENSDLSGELSDYYVRKGILSSMESDAGSSNSHLFDLIKQSDKIKSELLILIKPDSQDKKSATFLSEKFSPLGISTTQRWSRAVSHVLVMDSEYRKSRVGDAFITTKITNLSLKDTSGITISSYEIIATGNSVSNFNLSHEGAERHFSQQIDEMGVWSSLGIQQKQ